MEVRMKKGLVMEGGAMRGMFTAGVCDVLMENKIKFDGAVGVSAGAAFGCNFKSEQIGRAIRYNLRFCTDKRYWGIGSLIKTGDIFGVDFCYRELPFELDLFDVEAYNQNPMAFHIVCTDVETGKPFYRICNDGIESVQWMRASASMPLVSRVVEIEGRKFLDGGISDAIPLEYFEKQGYEKNLVILTRPADYVKKKNALSPLLGLMLGKYPSLVSTMKNRHIMYKETLEYIKEREKAGNALVIRPPFALPVKRTDRNAENLQKTYDVGRAEAEKRLEEIKSFLGK
jgi:predicted patatin/cPLA2 family phospholipase